MLSAPTWRHTGGITLPHLSDAKILTHATSAKRPGLPPKDKASGFSFERHRGARKRDNTAIDFRGDEFLQISAEMISDHGTQISMLVLKTCWLR
jgi:hypothetical protein